MLPLYATKDIKRAVCWVFFSVFRLTRRPRRRGHTIVRDWTSYKAQTIDFVPPTFLMHVTIVNQMWWSFLAALWWGLNSCQMPDIQLTQPTTAEPRPSLPKRGTYEERRKAEVMCCNITYNENCNRERATSKDVMQCLSMVYLNAKKGKEAVVESRQTPASYDYILVIKQAVVFRKEHECTS